MEIGNANPRFKKISEAYFNFRDEAYLWHQLADSTYDQYLIKLRRR